MPVDLAVTPHPLRDLFRSIRLRSHHIARHLGVSASRAAAIVSGRAPATEEQEAKLGQLADAVKAGEVIV